MLTVFIINPLEDALFESAILELHNSDILTLATTCSFGRGDQNIMMIRLPNDGEVLWSNTYDSRDYDLAYDVVENAEGELIVCGGMAIGGGGSDFEAFVFKTDANGLPIQ